MAIKLRRDLISIYTQTTTTTTTVKRKNLRNGKRERLWTRRKATSSSKTILTDSDSLKLY